MSGQSEKLKKAHSNLRKIEKSAIPSINMLIGKISKVKLRNTIIIAFVISMCLAFLIYYNGI